MCFQIEKRCCGSEVIASQSWKSSKKVNVGELEVWCGSGAPPILLQNEYNCLASIIASHFDFTCKERMNISTPAAFEHPPSAPPQSPKKITMGLCVRDLILMRPSSLEDYLYLSIPSWVRLAGLVWTRERKIRRCPYLTVLRVRVNRVLVEANCHSIWVSHRTSVILAVT